MGNAAGETVPPQTNLPDFASLETAWLETESTIAAADVTIQGLQAQIKAEERTKNSATADKVACIARWKAELVAQSSIYSASYFLDPHQLDSLESIKSRHQRGLLLHGLTESLAAAPQPVLALSMDRANITMGGYWQGKGSKRPHVTFRAIIGISQPSKAIKLMYDQTADLSTGAVTRLPSQLGLLVARAQRIESRVADDDDYDSGSDEKYFVEPDISDEESLELPLLARDRRWLRPHMLHTSQDGEPQSCRIFSEHDLYIGAEAIEAQCQSLSARIALGLHDQTALQFILKACGQGQ